MVGDVVGNQDDRPHFVDPNLSSDYGAEFVIVNAENAAGGIGITPTSPIPCSIAVVSTC